MNIEYIIFKVFYLIEKVFKLREDTTWLHIQEQSTLVEASKIAGGDVEMADIMRSNGKIYVVVLVLSTILIGILLYLFSLDRKLTKFEKAVGINIKDKK